MGETFALLPRRRRWRLPPSSLRSEGRSARAATAKNLVNNNYKKKD